MDFFGGEHGYGDGNKIFFPACLRVWQLVWNRWKLNFLSSLFEGMAIGLEQMESGVWQLFLAVAIHGLVGF